MKDNFFLNNPDYSSFEETIVEAFSFLESDYKFKYFGVREIDDGPRDQGLVARYSQEKMRIQIGWSAAEGSLVVLIKTNIEGLSREERSFYLEPFIEFMSEGKMKPIVPQIYLGMSIRGIEKAMDQRRGIFKNGFVNVVNDLACRFKASYPMIEAVDAITIKQYQKWYSKGKH